MKKELPKFVIAILIFYNLSAQCYGQATGFYYPQKENLENESVRVQKAYNNLEKAYEAYNDGDMKRTRYYLYESEAGKHVTAAFYYLLGQWCYDMKNFSAAKKYWMRGYDRRGCWECKDLIRGMEIERTLNKGKMNDKQIKALVVFALLGTGLGIVILYIR